MREGKCWVPLRPHGGGYDVYLPKELLDSVIRDSKMVPRLGEKLFARRRPARSTTKTAKIILEIKLEEDIPEHERD